MADTVVATKTCMTCRVTKLIYEFYRCRTYKDGLSYRCKDCDAEAMHRYNTSDKGRARNAARIRTRRKSHPLQNAAHKYIWNAIKHGRIPGAETLPCQQCGNQAECYHHHLGYEPPNHKKVIPLCDACHYKAHGKNKRV